MDNRDHHFLRLSFKQALQARENGNHPFGALLVNSDGQPFIAAGNSVSTQGDATAHAELNLVRAASIKYDAELLKTCTLYASAEPCPMCAGAIVWSQVRRVVFGLSMEKIYAVIGNDAQGLKMHARDVFKSASWPIEVIGPALEDEALTVHEGFW